MPALSEALPLKTKPLFKWPGGKRTLASRIVGLFPSAFNTYYEPFLGGGAVFFATKPMRAVLGDTNQELVNAYIQVRDHAPDLVMLLKSLKNTEENYYKIRASSPRSPLRRAARFIFLTRFAFNGIHRVNLKGQFNVPYGHKVHLTSVDEHQLMAASLALQTREIVAGDFQTLTSSAVEGDLIYFDPPYTVAHANNGFVKYNERIFSWADQERLSTHARELAGRGCTVIVSNADHPSVHALYSDFEAHIIRRPSVIAAASRYRKEITESIYILGGKRAI